MAGERVTVRASSLVSSRESTLPLSLPDSSSLSSGSSTLEGLPVRRRALSVPTHCFFTTFNVPRTAALPACHLYYVVRDRRRAAVAESAEASSDAVLLADAGHGHTEGIAWRDHPDLKERVLAEPHVHVRDEGHSAEDGCFTQSKLRRAVASQACGRVAGALYWYSEAAACSGADSSSELRLCATSEPDDNG